MPATGRHQAGVAAPTPTQPHLLVIIADVATGADVRVLLAELGRTILALTNGIDPRLAGIPAADLTITVGVGPAVVAGVDPSLPGAVALPVFARERIGEAAGGGDLLLQICASDPLVVPLAATALASTAGGRITERWRQTAFRGANVPIDAAATAPRNVFGFIDGIIGPRTGTQFEQNIWIDSPARVTDATIAVVRRMEIDVARFVSLDVARQEAVFGRNRATGAPLSGGTIATAPDLGAKTADGQYLIPADAHLRRAHSASTGVNLMLRRSYSIDQPTGLLFISFQNELRTFTATLSRMDESDAMMRFTTTTASGTFLILPGFTPSMPLGSTLFAS